MLKETQIKKVIRQLKKDGYVSRNWTIKNYIYRLSAIIHTLKANGYKFSAGFEDGDYIYVLRNKKEVFKK